MSDCYVYAYEYGQPMDLYVLDTNNKLVIESLNNKVVVGIDDPRFQLITTGAIRGEQIIVSGLTTNGFRTITHLTIPRGNGNNRQIPLIPVGDLGFTLDVNASVLIGDRELYLTESEKLFYKQLFITRFNPSHDGLVEHILQFS